MLNVLLVLLSAALVVSLVYIRGVRLAYKSVLADRDAYVQQLISSEQRVARAETECNFMKITLADVLKRPAHVTLTEENIHHLASLIESIFAPERMN